jgi:hypothetical protein
MMAIQGKIQCEGDVVHLIARQLDDLSSDLSALADRDMYFRNPSSRGMSSLTARLEAGMLEIDRSQSGKRGTSSSRTCTSTL